MLNHAKVAASPLHRRDARISRRKGTLGSATICSRSCHLDRKIDDLVPTAGFTSSGSRPATWMAAIVHVHVRGQRGEVTAPWASRLCSTATQ
jgi:hypothetical protein